MNHFGREGGSQSIQDGQNINHLLADRPCYWSQVSRGGEDHANETQCHAAHNALERDDPQKGDARGVHACSDAEAQNEMDKDRPIPRTNRAVDALALAFSISVGGRSSSVTVLPVEPDPNGGCPQPPNVRPTRRCIGFAFVHAGLTSPAARAGSLVDTPIGPEF